MKITIKKGVLLGLLATVLISSNVFGFATIMAPKGGDPVSFDLNVNNVSIYIDNQRIGNKGTKAFTYEFKRDGNPKVVTFKKPGYKTKSITLSTSFSGWFWVNMFIPGGSTASSIDSTTTKNHKQYSPNQYFIELKRS